MDEGIHGGICIMFRVIAHGYVLILLILLYSTIPYAIPEIISHQRMFIIVQGQCLSANNGHWRVTSIPWYSIVNSKITEN